MIENNINDCLIIAYDLSENDESILTVGRLTIENSLKINKVFRGKAATDLYKVLTNKNTKETNNEL